MYRNYTCLAAALICLLLSTPVWALDDDNLADASSTTAQASAILAGAKLDLPTLLLASQVLQLLQDDQAGFESLLTDLTASGDLTDAGADKLRTWLAGAGADYLALLAPAGSTSPADSAFIGPLPGGVQAGAGADLSVGPQQSAAPAGAGPGISLSADGTVQVQGVEQLLGLAGLGGVAEAASAAGVVLELDQRNVGVYIPLTVNGTAVSAAQMQLDGVSSELESLLHRLQPEARIYTVPTAWKEDAGAAWNYLCEVLTGKERKAAVKDSAQAEDDAS